MSIQLYLHYLEGGGSGHGFIVDGKGAVMRNHYSDAERIVSFFEIYLKARKVSWHRIDSLIEECFRAVGPVEPDADYIHNFEAGRSLLRVHGPNCVNAEIVQRELRTIVKPLILEHGFDRCFAD